MVCEPQESEAIECVCPWRQVALGVCPSLVSRGRALMRGLFESQQCLAFLAGRVDMADRSSDREMTLQNVDPEIGDHGPSNRHGINSRHAGYRRAHLVADRVSFANLFIE